MPHLIRSVAIGFITATLLVAGYAQRVTLADAWHAWRAASLPTAQPYASVKDAPVQAPAAPLPLTVNLAVPFTPQAPTGNWDAYHEEACEETSLIMVDRFYRGDPAGRLSPSMVETELRRITNLEDQLFGVNTDNTAVQMGEIAKKLYGHTRVEIVRDPTAQGIKAILAAGHPVIVPVAGRELHNPFFTAPGPVYHMLVIRGYTSSGFITNDPGTRRGEGYEYPFDVLLNAIHDWDASNIGQGPKNVMVVYPNPSL